MANVDTSSERMMPEWAASSLAAEFAPLPRIGILQAARRYWWLVIAPIVVLVPIVAIAALARTPTYSAEARLIVGRLNISTPGAIQGYAQASQDLAATYPLVVYADGVLGSVARQLHMSTGDVKDNISATQVPSSGIVRLDATSTSAAGAIKLANAASAALVSYLAKVNRDDQDQARLLTALQSADLAYQQAQAAVTPNAKGPISPAQEKARAAVEAAKVKVTGLVQEYQATTLTQAVTSLLQPVSSANSATSDRTSKLMLALLGALIAGGVFGLMLATLRANALARHTLTAPVWTPQPSRRGGKAGSGKPDPVQSTERSRSVTEPEGSGHGGPGVDD